MKKKLFENIIHGIFLILGLITVGSVLVISLYLVISGIPAIKEIGLINFLFGKEWASTANEPKYGILPFILTSVDGVKTELTYKEFEILKLFMSNPGIVFTRERLLSSVWGVDYLGGSRTVDMHIKTLRRKLGSAGEYIETVIGVGYRMVEKEW